MRKCEQQLQEGCAGAQSELMRKRGREETGECKQRARASITKLDENHIGRQIMFEIFIKNVLRCCSKHRSEMLPEIFGIERVDSLGPLLNVFQKTVWIYLCECARNCCCRFIKGLLQLYKACSGSTGPVKGRIQPGRVFWANRSHASTRPSSCDLSRERSRTALKAARHVGCQAEHLVYRVGLRWRGFAVPHDPVSNAGHCVGVAQAQHQ